MGTMPPMYEFRFDITSKTGQPIVIQASGDLSAWQNLTATNAPSDKFTFMDESAPNVLLRATASSEQVRQIGSGTPPPYQAVTAALTDSIRRFR